MDVRRCAEKRLFEDAAAPEGVMLRVIVELGLASQSTLPIAGALILKIVQH